MGIDEYDETMEVRPDERFDSEKLHKYLKGRLKGAEKPLAVRQFGGGAANLTYLLDFQGRHYVLRRPPLGPVAPSSHDMAREYKVLSVLYRAFPPAPRAFLLCRDESVIGAPFLIMERCRGVVVRRRMPRVFRDVSGAGLRISEALIDTLVDFHSVDYRALGLQDLGRPDGFIERQVEGWWERWQNAQDQERPEMESAYGWLSGNLPEDASASLVHNDYKLDNVMLADDDPSRVVAVLDWDMCTLGDPLSDLGALLAYWSEPDDPPALKAMAMMPGQGFPSRRELVKRYCDRSGRSRSQVTFYHVLGLFRVAVIVAQIYFRYQRGQTRDERFAALGALIPLLARRALEVAGSEA
ncbi:MAG TPA: phosphotransferase family protein [Acidobacteriota bacterium]|nr:phosphotransferase family protein [Acidobacteriota bacterium]